jgi:hypothetical protein
MALYQDLLAEKMDEAARKARSKKNKEMVLVS